MTNLEYKGYLGSVEYDRDNKQFYGKVLGMSKDLILYEGNTIEELEQDFHDGIESYFEGCEEMGIKPRKSFNGALNIRIPSEIHCKLALLAENSGKSINAIIRDTLEQSLKVAV